MMAVADIISHVLTLTDDEHRRAHNLRTFRYIIETRQQQLVSIRWEKLSRRKRHQAWKRLTYGTLHLLIDAMLGFTKSERDILSKFLGPKTREETAILRGKEVTETHTSAGPSTDDSCEDYGMVRRLTLDKKFMEDTLGGTDARAIALRELWDVLRAND
jgi:hypothetical protein